MQALEMLSLPLSFCVCVFVLKWGKLQAVVDRQKAKAKDNTHHVNMHNGFQHLTRAQARSTVYQSGRLCGDVYVSVSSACNRAFTRPNIRKAIKTITTI